MRCCRIALLCSGLLSVLPGQMQPTKIAAAEGNPGGLAVKAVAAVRNSKAALALASDGTVWMWGAGTNAPSRVGGLAGVTALAAGSGHVLALRDDGTLWAWGWNQAGQLGDGTTTDRKEPVQVRGVTGAVAIAAGDNHSLAMKGNGTVWEWGGWFPSVLGIIPQCCPYVPRVQPAPRAVAGMSGVTAVAASGNYSFAWQADGTVWAWDERYAPAPARISGLTGFVAIATDDLVFNPAERLLAVSADGTVWEADIDTHLPSLPENPALRPVSGFDNVSSVAFGDSGTFLAVKRDGTVWKLQGDGQAPAQVAGLSGVLAAAGGAGYALALTSDGTILAWGFDDFGQLGDGVAPWQIVPAPVSGLAHVAAIDAGGLAVKAEGTVWAWSPIAPAVQIDGLSDAAAVAAGYPELALKKDGSVWEFGGPAGVREVGIDHGLMITLIIEDVYGQVPLVLKTDGTVWAFWPFAPAGQPSIQQVSGLSEITAVAARDGGVYLALKSDGSVWEWGWDWFGNHATAPVRVEGLTGVVALAPAAYWSNVPPPSGLAVKDDGTVWEWEKPSSPPVQVSGLAGIERVASGGGHSLALRRDGTVWAWGSNTFGQLGDGTTKDRATPVQVAGLTGVVAISASASNSVALKSDETVWAWGDERSLPKPPVQVIPPGTPDLTIVMSHDGSFTVGAPGAYTLTITNTGAADTAGVVTVTDVLPLGLTYVSAAGAGWTCSAANQVVGCTNPARFPAGASIDIVLTVSVGASAWPGITNLASVENASDRNFSNNAIGDPTVVSPQSR